MKFHTSYHEAGHAAIHWMFGHRPEFIDMRGNKASLAFVAYKPLFDGPVLRLENLDKTARLFCRLGYQMKMMNHLAGYAAQSRVDQEIGSYGWFDYMLGVKEWERHKDCDTSRAVALSGGCYGANGNAYRFLCRMASWTDEALNDHRLWSVVEALAERLQTVKTRISGGRVFDIASKAWPSAKVPYMEMGPQWRRRFSVPRKLLESVQ